MNTKKEVYVVDWDKVKTVEDIVEILKGLQMTINIEVCSERIKKYAIKMDQSNDSQGNNRGTEEVSS